MPLNADIGGWSKPNRSKETGYLTEDQGKHIYKKVKLGDVINIGTINKARDRSRLRIK